MKVLFVGMKLNRASMPQYSVSLLASDNSYSIIITLPKKLITASKHLQPDMSWNDSTIIQHHTFKLLEAYGRLYPSIFQIES